MHDLSRRELLARLKFGVTLLPALATAPRSLLGNLLFDPDGDLRPARPFPLNPFTHEGKAVVVMVHGHHPPTMVRAGLDLLGGLDRLQPRGRRVLLKPNVVNDRPPPSTTNPNVVQAVLQAVSQAGARDTVVADSSGLIRLPTDDNFTATGIRAVVESAQGRILSLEQEPWVRVEPPGAVALPRYYVAQPAYDADLLINLPVIKTHRFAEYSCSLKNLVGIIHPRYRPSVTFLAGNWHERIAELNLAVHPHLTIADGTTIMIAGGPTSGTAARTDLILMSGDRIALDVVAIALIRTFKTWPKLAHIRPWEQRQIKRAIELRLGIGSPRELELIVQTTEKGAPDFDRLADKIRQDVFER